MEKSLSPDERIKRAEEIYYRRKEQNTSGKQVRKKVSNKKDFSMFKKMILQIAICIMIYTIFYMIKNTNYIFSEKVIQKTNEILSYDINIKNLYEQGMAYMNKFFNNNTNAEENINENENNAENVSNEETDVQENTVLQEESIGGEIVQVDEVSEENLSQMEKDAKSILASKSLILPLKGTITSRYGPRNPETPTVPKNHTGIDIAVNQGTVFNAAMSGIVEEVSSNGDLGNHIKIVSDDVMTVYGHCKTIYVKKGDTITQGQAIGEVGATGNATGPHLHFEIRKENRYVNPDLVLDFN